MTYSDPAGDDMRLGHATAEELAAYLSDALPVEERLALETHLAKCWSCRQEVTGARRLLRTSDRRWLAVPLAAAAGLALLLLRPGVQPLPDGILREAPDAGKPPAMAVVSPREGEEVRVDSLRLVWRAVPGEPLYRVTIADHAGLALWTAEVSDTAVVPPATVRLSAGGNYFWFVDALDAEARSVTTGTHGFRLVRR